MIASIEDREIIRSTIIKNYENIANSDRIVIFGCTMFARDIRDNLKSVGLDISAIIDNNPNKVGKLCLGVNVFSPQDYLKTYPETKVIICSKYYAEMVMQLKKLGCCDDGFIIIYVSECLNKFQDTEEDLNDAIKNVETGFDIYNKIADKYRNINNFFVCPYSGTGDIYMACTYLPAYTAKNSIDDYVLIVIGKKCFNTAVIFDIDNIEILSEDEMNNLIKAWEFLGNDTMHIKPLLFWGWRTKRYLYNDKYTRITFNEMFKYDVFELNDTEKRYIPKTYNTKEYVENLFLEKGLKKDKTVILAPYAGSFVSEISADDWMKIADELTKLGYSVCTNCNGTSELPVNGTVPVFFPYCYAVPIAEYAGGIIALRSGLCDIISSAKCKKIVIYESGFNATKYEYFSLNRMGLCNDATELIYQNDIDVIIEKICSCFSKPYNTED